MMLKAKTLSGINVTTDDSEIEIIIEQGKPVIMFFTVDENGNHGIFSQNQLTDFVRYFED